MAAPINVGSIMADLRVDSSHLERGLANARRALAAIENEIKNLDADLKRGAIVLQDHASRVAALGATYNQLKQAMQGAYVQLGSAGNGLGIVNAQAGQFIGQNWGKAALGLQQVGAIVDDIQYSIAACVNNVGPLVQSFAAAAGASGVLSTGIGAAAQIAVVAVYQLAQHWDQLAETLTGDQSRIQDQYRTLEGLTERVKALKSELQGGWFSDPVAETVGKLEDAEAKLRARREGQAGAASLRGQRDQEEREGDKRFADAVHDLGNVGALSRRLGEARAAAAPEDYMDSKTYRRYARSLEVLNSPAPPEGSSPLVVEGVKADRERARAAIEHALAMARRDAVQAAENDIGRALHDDQARDRLAAEFKHRGLGDAYDLVKGNVRTGEEARKADEHWAKFTDKLGDMVDKFRREVFPPNAPGKAVKLKEQQDREELKKIDDEGALYDALDAENLREWKRVKQHNKQKRRDEQKKAEEMLPAADEFASDLVAFFGKEGAAAKIEDALKDLGFEGNAGRAAGDIAKEAQDRLNDDIMKRALGGKSGRHKEVSQVFAGSEIGDKVQSAVGDADKKKLTLLEQIKNYQAQLLAAQLNQKHFGMRVAR